ncbi:hypothetical protein PTT_07193 [Pyrenophora teres f. teres 0-1]|uniref:Cytochrome c oxidase polypeptide VIIA n=1 Tax=Pyrenophora teres f. teres (strain 0-1) TaxID=861557 RepID=E3RH38_PYRTT|nr:hypothetical protein PTT_07193 [Pyrenophora teres f. teres 0-1]
MSYVSSCSSPVGPPQLHLSDDDIHHFPATAPAHYNSPLYETNFTMAIKPITGMLRRQIVLDLSVGMGLGLVTGYGWWYGYHVPAVRHRDAFYQKLEDERAAALGQK